MLLRLSTADAATRWMDELGWPKNGLQGCEIVTLTDHPSKWGDETGPSNGREARFMGRHERVEEGWEGRDELVHVPNQPRC